MDATRLTSISFGRLHRECEQKLIAVACSYVRDKDTAKDIVGDSFLSLWESRDRIDASDNIEAYLFRTVKNYCLRYRRDEKLERSVYETILKKERGMMEHYTTAIECCDPNEVFCNEIIEIFSAELERMPDLAKKIFMAHKVEGKSYREIAADLKISPKKVDKELQNVAIKLRRSLKDYAPLLSLIITNLSN